LDGRHHDYATVGRILKKQVVTALVSGSGSSHRRGVRNTLNLLLNKVYRLFLVFECMRGDEVRVLTYLDLVRADLCGYRCDAFGVFDPS